MRSKRSLFALLFGAFVLASCLSGCAVFGDADAAASDPTAVDDGEANRTVRVTTGDRFFDIAPASLFDENGELEPDALDTLSEQVSRLSAGTAAPNDAGVIFDGDQFVVNPAIPGSTPDIEGLARALADPDLVTLDLPFLAIQPTVGNDEADAYATELNERLANGLDVAVGGEKHTLPTSVLGEATTVELIDEEWVVSVNYDGIATQLSAMFSNVGSEGGQATFTVEPGTSDEPGTVSIVPGAPATACCGDASVERIVAAMTSELDTATLQLENVDGPRGVAWAESLGITELVGSFTTRYTAGQDRNINIERIAELSQGMIIEPGQTWSLNESIGQRTIENGFVPAGTIINGHLTDSVGGGISQFATTIFNAAFFAGLEFDDYSAHSIYFSRYPYGREATISWPAPQLEIHNPTPYGVLIWPTTTSNSVTVDLYSTKWAEAEQTGQFETPVQEACTRVTTERTRTFVDGTVDVDSVFAIYREEGIGCNGEPTDDPDAPPEPEEPAEPAEEANEGETTSDEEADPNADGETDSDANDRPNRNRDPDGDETDGDEANEDGASEDDAEAGDAEPGGEANQDQPDADGDEPAEPEAPADEEQPTENDPQPAEDAGNDDPDQANEPVANEQTSDADQPADDQPADVDDAPEDDAPEGEGPAADEIAAAAPEDAALGTDELP